MPVKRPKNACQHCQPERLAILALLILVQCTSVPPKRAVEPYKNTELVGLACIYRYHVALSSRARPGRSCCLLCGGDVTAANTLSEKLSSLPPPRCRRRNAGTKWALLQLFFEYFKVLYFGSTFSLPYYLLHL